MFCDCYLRKGIVYIPTEGMMNPGLFRNVEPVAVVPVSERDALHQAFAETIARGNPKVPLPRGSDIPPPLMPKYAGVKSWGAFARGTTTWWISEKEGIYRIQGLRKDGRGWVPDPDKLDTFPPGTGVDEVIERMIEILQAEAAQQQRSG